MGLQHSFDTISRVVEQVESQGRSVRDLTVETAPAASGDLSVEMALPVPMCWVTNGSATSPLTPKTASLSEDGGIAITCDIADILPLDNESVSPASEQAVRVEDGNLVVTVSFTVETAESAEESTTVAEAGEPRSDASALDTAGSPDHCCDEDTVTAEPAESALARRLDAARSEDVPAYDDTDYLQTLYDSCGTFTEMSEHIEMDIAAETVRRYMIEADIHEPASYDTAAHESLTSSDDHDATQESESAPDDATATPSPPEPETVPDEQILTDGIGLPDDVAVEDIVDAVANGTTVYEVQRSLELDHGQTRDLLKQLNVLDFVLHRIDGPSRSASKGDIVQRMRQCSSATA
jgi:hypothetical protein